MWAGAKQLNCGYLFFLLLSYYMEGKLGEESKKKMREKIIANGGLRGMPHQLSHHSVLYIYRCVTKY